ncbi:MAG: hypothetical protein LBR17_04525 [Bacteroidales bacterium]|jgi:hypothetical protein|nr:hypothetical protein [Bacteroidales bacterium]
MNKNITLVANKISRTIILFAIFCVPFIVNSQTTVNNSSDLANNTGKQVIIEGKVLHVCPVAKNKIKLRMSDGTVVTLLHNNEKLQKQMSESGKDYIPVFILYTENITIK